MDSQDIAITAVCPSLGVPGGELTIECRGFKPDLASCSGVLFGEMRAIIVSASEDRIIVRLPESPNCLGAALESGGRRSELYPFTLATKLATGLHPVANPVVTPDGSLITTISGSRGEQVSQPVVRVTRSGEKVPLACQVMNPTGLALDRDGQLYISSRHDGTVYRYAESEELEIVAEDLGEACGLTFDSKGYLYIGDRRGKVFRISPAGSREEFALLEPSISAYHLAVDSQDRLYVTGPTFSMRDNLYRISTQGKAEILLQGLARPQGMAFIPDGNLLIACAYQGKKGVFRFNPVTRSIEQYITAPILVGIAVAGEDIFLADGSSVFWLQSTSSPALVS